MPAWSGSVPPGWPPSPTGRPRAERRRGRRRAGGRGRGRAQRRVPARRPGARTCTRRSGCGASRQRSGCIGRRWTSCGAWPTRSARTWCAGSGSIRLAGLPGEPVFRSEAADRARELADCRAHARRAAPARHRGRGLRRPARAGAVPARRRSDEPGRAGRSRWPAAGAPGRAARADRGARRSRPAGSTTEHGTVSAGVMIVAVDGRLERAAAAARRPGPHSPAADAGHRAGRTGPVAVPGLRPVGLRLRAAVARTGGCSSAAAVTGSPTPSGRPTASRRAGAGLHRARRDPDGGGAGAVSRIAGPRRSASPRTAGRCAPRSPTGSSRSVATTAPGTWSARSPPAPRSPWPSTAPPRRPTSSLRIRGAIRGARE